MSNNSPDQNLLRLSLARIQGIKRETIYDYIKASSSLRIAYRNMVETVQRQQSDGRAQKVILPKAHLIEQELQMITSSGAHIIGIDMESYPWMLKEIFNPPIALTVKGNIDILRRNIVAIVGTRRSSIVSDKLAYNIAKELSDLGFTIASGLATGIDTAAHKGAINNTIAIIGTGINHVYPKSNTQLSEQIINNGGIVISEFPLNTNAAPEHFPQRNRIIAGIGYGVLVIEAKDKSGSLITARYALEYNREIYAIPGFPTDLRYAGNNSLIKNNAAKMVESSRDIYEDLKERIKQTTKVKENNIISENSIDNSPSSKDITANRKHILQALSSTPVSADDIANALNIHISVTRIALLELEIEEIIARDNNGNFFLVTQQDG